MGIHSLLTPDNCAVIFIDHQLQITFCVASIDRQRLIHNTVGLAKTAKDFDVPVILTNIETESFRGFIWPQLLEIFPGKQPLDRTSLNPWEHENFVAQIKQIGRKKLVMAAPWEACLTPSAIQGIEAGYKVYAVIDATGGKSAVAHDLAIQRMIQAGVVPVTWLQVLREFQRNSYVEKLTTLSLKLSSSKLGSAERVSNALTP